MLTRACSTLMGRHEQGYAMIEQLGPIFQRTRSGYQGICHTQTSRGLNAVYAVIAGRLNDVSWLCMHDKAGLLIFDMYMY